MHYAYGLGPARHDSSEVGSCSAGLEMGDPQPNSWLYREICQLVDTFKPHLGRLATHRDLAAHNPAEVGNGEPLPYLTVPILDDVLRIGVDTQQPRDLDVEPVLFLRLAHRALLEGIPDLHDATRQ